MRKLFALLLLALPLSIIAQEKIKVACIGNSVTYGYGHKEPAKTSYPSQLQQMLGDKNEVKNEAMPFAPCMDLEIVTLRKQSQRRKNII